MIMLRPSGSPFGSQNWHLEEQTDHPAVPGFEYKRAWPNRPGGENPSRKQAELPQHFDGKLPSGLRLVFESAVGLSRPGQNFWKTLDRPGLFSRGRPRGLAFAALARCATDNPVHYLMRGGCARLFGRGYHPLCKGIKSTSPAKKRAAGMLRW